MSYICDTECIYYFTFLGQFSVESASDYIVQLSASFCMDISLYCFYSRLSFQKNFFSINRSSSCCEVNSRRFFPCCFKSYWILLFFIFFSHQKTETVTKTVQNEIISYTQKCNWNCTVYIPMIGIYKYASIFKGAIILFYFIFIIEKFSAFFSLSVCISIFVLKFQGYRYHFPVEMNELFCQITAMRLWNSEIKRLEVANTLETYTFSHCLLWVHCDHDDQISRNKYSIFFQIAEYYWIKHANYHCNAVIEQ